ncbi:hypothetical protein N752_30060 [Desulforamulus aquiferis]|nr:hypothetical protein N752_30060 [Desulforamulus aquiferis]
MLALAEGASCSFVVRGVHCKYIAFVAMAELAHEAAERSAHRQVQEVLRAGQ